MELTTTSSFHLQELLVSTKKIFLQERIPLSIVLSRTRPDFSSIHIMPSEPPCLWVIRYTVLLENLLTGSFLRYDLCNGGFWLKNSNRKFTNLSSHNRNSPPSRPSYHTQPFVYSFPSSSSSLCEASKS